MSDAPKDTNVARLPSKAQFKRLGECHTLREAFQSEELRKLIAEAVPRHVDASTMLRTWIQAASRQPLIYEADMRQALGAFQSLAFLGLRPNTPLGHAYVIPFKSKRFNKVTRQRDIDVVELQVLIGYPGYIDLAINTGLYEAPHADVVFDARAENFSWSFGSKRHLEHRGRPHNLRTGGDPEYAYCYVRMRENAGEAFDVMTWEEVLSIRNRSQAYRTALRAKETAEEKGWRVPATWTDAPWVRDAIEMGKKTAIRRLYKVLPKAPELRAASALEDQMDAGKRLDWGPVIDGTATPMDGIPESDEPDAPDPSDPGAAFGMRDGGEPPPPPPPVRTAAPTRQAPPPRRAAPKVEPPPPPAEPDFEAVLIDAWGEIHGEPFSDPVRFAAALVELWGNTPDLEAAEQMIEHNADAIDDARRVSPEAARLLDRMTAPPGAAVAGESEADAGDPAPTRYVAVDVPPADRGDPGKPSWGGWVKVFKDTLATVPAADVEGWLEAQRSTIERSPVAQRALVINTVVARCRGADIAPPQWLAEAARGAPAPQQRPAPGEPSGPPEPPIEAYETEAAPPDARSADERWIDDRIAEAARCRELSQISALIGSTAVQHRMRRLKRESPLLFQRGEAALTKRLQELGG